MSKDFQFIVDEEIHDMIHNITYMDKKQATWPKTNNT